MIYLVSGSPRIGKSTMAKKLAEAIKARVVSTDELEDPNQEDLVIFHSDAEKNTMTSSERVEAIIKEAKPIIPTIENIIKQAINDHQDIVIEGVHLFPSYVSDFLKKFGEDKIKAIFIGSADVKLILQGMTQNTSPNDWPKDFNKDALRQIALFTKAFSDYLRDECKKYNLLYKERSGDFRKDVTEIVDWV